MVAASGANQEEVRMAQVIYIDSDEQRYPVEVDSGVSLMQAAIDNVVPKILGDCGGAAACATCHVYIDPEWAERTGTASELELDLMDGLLDTRPTSRLACQISVSDELDGLVVHLPERML
jgi:ferredoxin, 2Fe-2S